MSIKRQRLTEIMQANPAMSNDEAMAQFEAKYPGEFVSVSLINVVRGMLTGKYKITFKHRRVLEFIRDNPDLNPNQSCEAYEAKYSEKLSRAFYFACRKELDEKRVVLRRSEKVPRVVEGVWLHKIILEVGGLERFDYLLKQLEKFGSFKKIRSVLNAIRPELFDQPKLFDQEKEGKKE